MTTRSTSASVYGMNWLHFPLPFSSAHADPFHFTINPVSGALGNFLDIFGDGFGGPPAALTLLAETTVVWLPDSKTETKTRSPVASFASERGCLPRMFITCGSLDGDCGSNTLTW